MRHFLTIIFLIYCVAVKAQIFFKNDSLFVRKSFTQIVAMTQCADVTGMISAKLNLSDSSIYQPKYRVDTLRANVYTTLAGKSPTNHTHATDSVLLQSKYRSDTARANTYTALAGKQATGNYLTSLVTGSSSIGYSSGNGGVVTQATSKSTGVTLNKLAGEITMNGAALAAATIVSFTLSNSTIASTDVIILNHVTTGTRGGYTLNAQCGNGSAVIYVRNNTAGSLSEAIVIRYVVIKSANN